MKTYPSIPYWSESMIGSQIWAFDKLDGSNIRFEWSKKRGWYKFGTRKTMINQENESFGKAVGLFHEKYGQKLEEIFKKNENYRNCTNFVVFAEWVGKNSFAGWHDPNDNMDIILFDVNQYKKGMIPPKQFIEDFGDLHTPKLIYRGVLDKEFIKNVKSDKYRLSEGVIIKGVKKVKGNDLVWMAKIKTKNWLEKLKNKYGENELIKELNNNISLL